MAGDRKVLPGAAGPLIARRLPLVIGALVGLACGSDTPFTPPGGNLAVSVTVYRCSGGCGTTTGPLDSLHRGDTALVRLSVADTAGDSATVLLKAPCAVNVTILGGTGVAPTLPSAPSCADSTQPASVSAVPLLRDFTWIVPAGFAVGDYTLRGEMVVDPPVQARRAVRID
jgi:hypothetical protein